MLKRFGLSAAALVAAITLFQPAQAAAYDRFDARPGCAAPVSRFERERLLRERIEHERHILVRDRNWHR